MTFSVSSCQRQIPKPRMITDSSIKSIHIYILFQSCCSIIVTPMCQYKYCDKSFYEFSHGVNYSKVNDSSIESIHIYTLLTSLFNNCNTYVSIYINIMIKSLQVFSWCQLFDSKVNEFSFSHGVKVSIILGKFGSIFHE